MVGLVSATSTPLCFAVSVLLNVRVDVVLRLGHF